MPHYHTHLCIFVMQRMSQWVECCVCVLHCRGSVFCVEVNPMPLRISLPPSPRRLRWQTVVSSDTDWSWLRLMTSCWCHQHHKRMVMLSVLKDTNIWLIQWICFRIRRLILTHLTQVTFSWFRSLYRQVISVCVTYTTCTLSVHWVVKVLLTLSYRRSQRKLCMHRPLLVAVDDSFRGHGQRMSLRNILSESSQRLFCLEHTNRFNSIRSASLSRECYKQV